MKHKILDLIENRGKNYIFPFFWQHGEEEATLREYMEVIHNSGIGAVCVECRPHPDFCGPKWWQDMDVIMDEARKRGMKVWLLDDAHFPTGYANGALADADPALCKQYLSYNSVDVFGPTPQVSIDVTGLAKHKPNPLAAMGNMLSRGAETRVFEDDELFAVTAYRFAEGDVLEESVDLTDNVKDGKLIWDVPCGMWRIFVTYLTRNGGGRTDYINVLDHNSVRVLIDAVYEPNYSHYKDDFGKTFVGFFSDEPLFGNTVGFNFDEIIGRKRMPLPWSKDVPGMLAEYLGENWKTLMPILWKDSQDQTLNARVRYAYMDTVTRLVRENFSNQLGKWCSERGVEYIGHVIEDNNQHARLGSSLGHYFRALDGQHMSGIDDIGGQVLPGGQHHTRPGFIGAPGDGEFYHFALGKLGSSHAHIDPKKQGRAMIELFGAYGWSFGVREMKYVTDHFLVRGINHFVPHAFSPKAFPDPDCPPHFYAHGENPQYRHFGFLMRYINRVSHLINGGLHVAPVALLYHGEAEWTGKHMHLQKPARKLLENQIDFDIIPSDIFGDGQYTIDGNLQINGESYRALVVPYAQYVTKAVAEFAAKATDAGFPVLFVDALPDGVSDSNTESGLAANIGKAVPLCNLTQELRTRGIFDVTASPCFVDLRYYRYDNLYIFNNESICDSFTGTVTVPNQGSCYLYDAWENVCRPIESEKVPGGTALPLILEPYQSCIVIFGEAPAELRPLAIAEGRVLPLDFDWEVSLCEAKQYPNFAPSTTMHELNSIGHTHPDFSGFIRYEKSFELTGAVSAVLELDDAYEGVEVWCNGQNAGIRIAPPYVFDLSSIVREGKNDLRVEVATTLERKVNAMPRDNGIYGLLAGASAIAPTGLVGGARVYVK